MKITNFNAIRCEKLMEKLNRIRKLRTIEEAHPEWNDLAEELSAKRLIVWAPAFAGVTLVGEFLETWLRLLVQACVANEV